MSSSDSMLFSMLATSNETVSEDEYIVIDPENRTMTIPESQLLFGVYQDNDVERKRFKCPRYIGDNDIDLSACYIFINYVSARGRPGQTLASDVTFDEEFVTFDWWISSNVMDANKDTDIRFAIQVKKQNEDGEEVHVFSTKPYTGQSFATVEPGYVIAEEYADIILDLLAKIDAIEDKANTAADNAVISSNEAATSAAAASLSEINAKAYAEQALGTVDYEHNRIGFETSSESNINILNSPHEEPFIRSMTVYGNTGQLTSTGAQLARFNDVENYTHNGITWSCSNGIVECDGAATGVAPSHAAGISFDAPVVAGNYFVSGGTDSARVYVSVEKDGASTYYSNETFALDGTEQAVTMYVQVSEGITANKQTVYPMLNSGTEAIPWEPYTGGVPGPNPEYPQSIVNVFEDGVLNETISGKNLLYLPESKTVTSNGITVTYDSATQIVTVNGILTNAAYASYSIKSGPICPMIEGAKYTLSAKYISGTVTNNGGLHALAYLGKRTKDDAQFNWLAARISQNGDNSSVIEATDIAYCSSIWLYISSDVDNGWTFSDYKFRVQLEQSEIATDFEPAYLEQTAITLAEPLRGLPTETDGNVTIDGQQYIADTLEIYSDGTGKIVRRCAAFEFDGSSDESWTLANNSSETKLYLLSTYTVYDAKPCNDRVVTAGYCDKLIAGAADSAWTNAIDNAFSVNRQGAIHVRMNQFNNDLDAFKQYLTENPIRIVVPINNCIEETLTASEVEAFVKMGTYKPVTYVYNDELVHQKVVYTVGQAAVNDDIKNNINNIDAELRDINNRIRLMFNDVVVPIENFVAYDEIPNYAFRVTVPLEGVTTSMMPDVVFSFEDSIGGNYAPIADPYNGGIYLYSKIKPSNSLNIPTIVCWRGDV